MNFNRSEFRVMYADTDHGGVVYYGSYLRWMESGRTEILRDNGISYVDYEDKGMFVPVRKVEVEYFTSAKYDDIIIIETTIEKIGNSSVEFSYKIIDKDSGKTIASAKTINVFIKKNGEKTSVPNELRDILKN